MLPDFLIIGAQKAGTSWLADNLAEHPQVFMPRNEIHFFDKDYNFNRGLPWYEAHFAKAKPKQRIGEKTPDYLWANGQGIEGHLPNVHYNLHSVLPEAQLIIILRNPVERAISAVRHIIRTGRVSPFENIDALLVGDKQHLIAGHGVIEYGYYYRQIKAYQTLFRPEQIYILIYEEDVVQTPNAGLEKSCQFLNIDSEYNFQLSNKRSNRGIKSKFGLALSYYFPIMRKFLRQVDHFFPSQIVEPSLHTSQKLYQIYAKENDKLFAMLGREIQSWQL